MLSSTNQNASRVGVGALADVVLLVGEQDHTAPSVSSTASTMRAPPKHRADHVTIEQVHAGTATAAAPLMFRRYRNRDSQRGTAT